MAIVESTLGFMYNFVDIFNILLSLTRKSRYDRNEKTRNERIGTGKLKMRELEVTLHILQYRTV